MTDTQIKGKILLESLLEEINNCDPEMFPPFDPVVKKEKIVGLVEDEYVKKVFSLNAFYRREGRRLQVDAESMGMDLKTHSELHLLKQKHELLLEMFWYLIRSQLNHWHADIGIRKGWTIVETPNDNNIISSSEIPKFLRRIIEDLNE